MHPDLPVHPFSQFPLEALHAGFTDTLGFWSVLGVDRHVKMPSEVLPPDAVMAKEKSSLLPSEAVVSRSSGSAFYEKQMFLGFRGVSARVGITQLPTP